MFDDAYHHDPHLQQIPETKQVPNPSKKTSPSKKPRKSSLSSTEDAEAVEMIDTSSNRKPSKPKSQKKKPLTQIQEEEEELHLDSEEEEEDPLEESKRALAKALESSASASASEEEETFEEQQRQERIAQHRPTVGVKSNSNFLSNFIYRAGHGRLPQEAGEAQYGLGLQVHFEEEDGDLPRFVFLF
jgi:hypothetical protein